MPPSLCNLQLQQYSFLYIHTLHDDFSDIADVHFHFVHISYFLSYFWLVLNLDIFPSEMLRGCLVFYNLYLQQYSLLYIQTSLNGCSHIEDVHFLFGANIFFFSLFWQLLNLDIFKQFSFLYIQTLCYDCSHSEHVLPIFMHIWYYIFECLT